MEIIMFNQQKYINEYNKTIYKDYKLRVKKKDQYIIDHLSKQKSINKYILKLVQKDLFNTRQHNFIRDNIIINFPLSRTMENLVLGAEIADLMDDYGAYINYGDAIDTQAKNETKHHQMTESQWKLLASKYWP